MPDKKERDLWWGYLAGKPESDWNPPKQPKQSQSFQQHRRSGITLAGFADENDASYERRRQESWQTNDEGEVELVLRVDPSESLPTPTGSPTPPECGELNPSSGTLNTPDPITFKPREPLPSVLRYVDQVSCFIIVIILHSLDILANGFASSHVFYTLDQCSPSTS